MSNAFIFMHDLISPDIRLHTTICYGEPARSNWRLSIYTIFLIRITLKYIPPFVMESRLHGEPARPIGPVSINSHFRLHTTIRYGEPARSSESVSSRIFLIRLTSGYNNIVYKLAAFKKPPIGYA